MFNIVVVFTLFSLWLANSMQLKIVTSQPTELAHDNRCDNSRKDEHTILRWYTRDQTFKSDT